MNEGVVSADRHYGFAAGTSIMGRPKSNCMPVIRGCDTEITALSTAPITQQSYVLPDMAAVKSQDEFSN